MKYYVNFISEYGTPKCICFEEDREQAEHFAKLINGRVYYGY